MEKSEERTPSAFDICPDALRRLGHVFGHVVRDHEGDISKCPDVAQFNLEQMELDLKTWADRIEQGTPFKQRMGAAWGWAADRYDGLLLVPAAVYSTVNQDYAAGMLLMFTAAWYRVGTWMRTKKQEERSTEGLMPIPLSALMQSARVQDDDVQHDQGLYL